MGYINDFERDLRARIEALEPGVEPDALVQWLKDQMLQSYRNGLSMQRAAGKDGERVQKNFRRNYKQ